MKLHFATIFDINYLSRGLALYESLHKWHDNFILYVVCLDAEVRDYFLRNKLSGLEIIALAELEGEFPELNEVKRNMGYIDYLFTLSPFIPSIVLKKNPSVPFVCSLDCDQYFFNNTEFVFRRLDECSVLIMPHRFTKQVAHHIVYGKYNVSFQVFKNDEIGNKCLALWRSQCIEWCYDKLDGDRFADQKYLETWQSYFGDSIQDIDQIGMGLAPWNLDGKKIYSKKGFIFVNNEKLILYHYQGMRFVSKSLLNSGLSYYHVKPSVSVMRLIMYPIVKSLLRYQKKQVSDSIGRNLHKETSNKTFFGLISSRGMYYIGDANLINLDFFYFIKKLMSGDLYSRLKHSLR
jgi:hypothetical protein